MWGGRGGHTSDDNKGREKGKGVLEVLHLGLPIF